MSIEAKLDALKEAVEANTAAVEANNKLLSGGIAKKAAAKTSTTKKAAPKKEAAPKKMTAADFRKKFEPYLSVKDKDELTERKGHLRAIADYFGVAKVTDLTAADYPEALGYLQTYMDGETPEFDGGAEEEEEESVL